MKKLLILFFPILIYSQNASDFRINHFSVNNGLSQYDVSSIVQDKLGFIWVGTYDGLNRFDGFQPKIFRHQSGANSILNNRVVSLETDSTGNIWIGCDNGGLSIYNIHKAAFYHIKYNDKNPFERYTVSLIKRLSYGKMMIVLQNGSIFQITVNKDDINQNTISINTNKIQIQDKWPVNLMVPRVILEVNQHLLIGFQDSGLYEMTQVSGTGSYSFKLVLDKPINAALVDKERNIWIATNSGLNLFKYFDNYSSCVNLTNQLPGELTSDINLSSLCEDDNQHKWIGTFSDGLYQLRKNNSNVEEYSFIHFLKSNSNLHSNHITKLFIDKSNILWIGSNNDGLGFTDLSRKIFNEVNLNIPGDAQSNVFTSSIFADSYNNVWVGSEDYGLFRLDKKRNQVSNYSNQSFNNLKHVVNTCALEDKWGNLWFGTWNGCYNLYKNDILKNRIKFNKITDITFPDKLSSAIYAIVESVEGDLWLGSKVGLYRVKRNLNTGAIMNIHKYLESQNGLNTNVFAICPLPNNQIFVGMKGSGAKFITYNQQNEDIITENFDINQKQTEKKLNSNNVWSICNAGGLIWMGTDEGVVKLRKNHNSYEVVPDKSLNMAIGYCKVVSVIEDQQANVWLATNDGAVRVNPKNGQIQFFRNKEGLKSNTVSAIAVRKTDGFLYFGGIKGVNFCNPVDLNPPTPNIVPKIIQIKINGNDMLDLAQKAEIDNVDDTPFLKDLKLKYNQNNIALTISTFEFINPTGSDFQYKMEGLDEKWISSRNGERIIIYQNLPPGKYKFLLKSSKDISQSGLEPLSITFIVGVPPWLQWWAILIYLIVLGLILYFLSKILRSRLQLNNELKMEKYSRIQEKELNEFKTKLFVNVSHELRTPLSLILSPLKEISKFELDSKVNKLFKIVQYNANRLLLLTNQILDAERNDHLILNIEERDIIGFLKLILSNFAPLANEKNIVISENYNQTKMIGFFDPDILEKTISNLILNALKYTPQNGHIHIQCNIMSNDLQMLELSIQDDGKGISEDKMDEIFKPFFQVEGGNGFGIGLSVVKQLVESHHGNIKAHSKEGMGSKFIIEIPTSKSVYNSQITEEESSEITFDDMERKLSNSEISKKSESVSVLVVEDNDDLRQYLTDCLISDFIVYTAENGEIGFQLAKKQNPDIIISDIMMPVLNGLDMAKLIFSNDSTKHIPFIFLTAKGSIENQFEGVKTGATDYIVKPVDVDILKSKITNQIQIIRANRERVRSIYLHSEESVVENPEESQFIIKAQAIITANLSNNNFDVSMLASEMANSRMQLHRKFKAIMDTSPGEFIRLTKLKIAYSYLTSGQYNVSEIVLLCGFENHSHFTKMIKQHFGKTPQAILTESKSKQVIEKNG